MPLTERNCVVCNNLFKPKRNPHQTCCSRDCSKINNKNRCKRWYHEKRSDPIFREQKRERGREYSQRPLVRAMNIQNKKLYRITHHQQDIDYHRNKNAIIRYKWSRGVNGRETWRQAEEEVSIQVLLSEGFIEVMSLKPFKHNFYFDIRAINNITRRVCVFQVTTRTHTDIKQRLSYATTLNLEFFVLYVRPDLTGYVLKNARAPGAHALYLSDLKKIKTIQDIISNDQFD
jgi:hypothetical protein